MKRRVNLTNIREMNGTKTWDNTIEVFSDPLLPPPSPQKCDYQLMATGDADVNGRKYVAVPQKTKMTRELKKKLNLW